MRAQGHLDLVVEPAECDAAVLALAAGVVGDGRTCSLTIGPVRVGTGPTVELPALFGALLGQVIGALARGESVTITSRDQTLSTQEAAELLGVSRPTLVRLLERGEIAYDKPGKHRRVLLHDLRIFQESHHHVLVELEKPDDH